MNSTFNSAPRSDKNSSLRNIIVAQGSVLGQMNQPARKLHSKKIYLSYRTDSHYAVLFLNSYSFERNSKQDQINHNSTTNLLQKLCARTSPLCFYSYFSLRTKTHCLSLVNSLVTYRLIARKTRSKTWWWWWSWRR